MLNKFIKELKFFSDPFQAKVLQRFFKTNKGEYGEGDIFLGIKVPVQRNLVKKFDLNLDQIQVLLNSKIHEHRFSALVFLLNKYEKNSEEVFNFYLKNSKKINNWDLVDAFAPKIVGKFLVDKNKDILYKLARSKNLWEKRISIISTLWFIRNNKFNDTLKISEILLKDSHDLIHKAVGWMLREVGKKDQGIEEKFLKKHYKKMPRTMLRYAIEKFDEVRRKKYLKGDI